MAATGPLKKLTSMKEWMAQADLPKEGSTVKNDQPVATPLVK